MALRYALVPVDCPRCYYAGALAARTPSTRRASLPCLRRSRKTRRVCSLLERDYRAPICDLAARLPALPTAQQEDAPSVPCGAPLPTERRAMTRRVRPPTKKATKIVKSLPVTVMTIFASERCWREVTEPSLANKAPRHRAVRTMPLRGQAVASRLHGGGTPSLPGQRALRRAVKPLFFRRKARCSAGSPCRLPLRPLAVIMWGRVPPTPPLAPLRKEGKRKKRLGYRLSVPLFPLAPIAQGERSRGAFCGGSAARTPSPPPVPRQAGEVPPTTPKFMLVPKEITTLLNSTRW